MYGSNYLGQQFYGGGPAVGTTFTLHTVTGTATTSATIAFQLLINATVSVTITTTATIQRTISKTLTATALSVVGLISSLVVPALNIRKATTKMLTLATATFNLNAYRNTKDENPIRVAKKTTEDGI
jgi:hypothetical protein